jgi:hypothetical protein
MGAFDGFRTLFNIRKDRRRPPPGPKPKMGAKIYLHDVRMFVQAGLSDELWDYLQGLGFREITFNPDRRIYRDLPRSIVAQLYDASRDEWRAILKLAIRESSKRPVVNGAKRPLRATST